MTSKCNESEETSSPFPSEMISKLETTRSTTRKPQYEGQSKITEPCLITFESSKMDIYLDDISL